MRKLQIKDGAKDFHVFFEEQGTKLSYFDEDNVVSVWVYRFADNERGGVSERIASFRSPFSVKFAEVAQRQEQMPDERPIHTAKPPVAKMEDAFTAAAMEEHKPSMPEHSEYFKGEERPDEMVGKPTKEDIADKLEKLAAQEQVKELMKGKAITKGMPAPKIITAPKALDGEVLPK